MAQTFLNCDLANALISLVNEASQRSQITNLKLRM